MIKLRIARLISLLIVSLSVSVSFAQTSYHTLPVTHYHHQSTVSGQPVMSPVVARARKEDKIKPNSFAVTLYKPNYLLPFYYTGSPDNRAYQSNTPNGERLKHAEVKYQVSFKIPIFKHLFNRASNFNLAYTQQSYWQAYNHTAFIRETDYEPELFLANEVNYHIYRNWDVNFLNVGAVHQSNGFGDSLERSWNRIYLEVITSTPHWMISLRPWYIIHDHTMQKYNSNIADYLGYGQIIAAYKNHNHVFSIRAHNIIEGAAKHATAELTWSFPLSTYLNGYLQFFSGYGQSLIEYNHRTNSAGIGISINDWV